MDAPSVADAENLRSPPPAFRCDLCDRDAVHKIADLLLLGVATSCVDSTTGDPFRTPASLASDARRDLLEYLSVRSQSLASDPLLLLENPPDFHPADLVADLAEDFAASRRTLLARVSGWLLSEAREDRIDDLVQDLDSTGFWLRERREDAARGVLRALDYRKEYHCAEGFDSEDLLARHRAACPFRATRCGNEGCGAAFCASRAAVHEEECAYRVLECEQGCGDTIVRREMDRHCITVCPMRIIDCVFHAVGCPSTVPRRVMPQHCREYLRPHLAGVLRKARKMEAVEDEDLVELASMLEKSQSDDELYEALDVRSLTSAVRRQEVKIKKLEAELKERRRREKEEAELEERRRKEKEEAELEERRRKEKEEAELEELHQKEKEKAELEERLGKEKEEAEPEERRSQEKEEAGHQEKEVSDQEECRHQEKEEAELEEYHHQEKKEVELAECCHKKKEEAELEEHHCQEKLEAGHQQKPEAYRQARENVGLNESRPREEKAELEERHLREEEAELKELHCQDKGEVEPKECQKLEADQPDALSHENKLAVVGEEDQSGDNRVKGEPSVTHTKEKLAEVDHEKHPSQEN